ncbi:MAG: beta-ketoacyl synthase chain length factor [Gammaproteobacteria bacterium]|nr:beta-ketoacyl synthase chain length factor [Gammaproteobacteria bacterium]
MSLTAWIDGVGVLGPGLADWPAARAALCGARPHEPAATILPAPSILPAAERRRTGRVVKLALAVALEATASAAADPRELGSVFCSSGADGANCHEICVALAAADREMSPTRFTNSVHNAASGYWGIGVGAMRPSQVLCAFDASFAAGLLEALVRIAVDGEPLLLVTYDTGYPPPLQAKRPIPDAFGAALVLAATRGEHSIARIDAALGPGAESTLADPGLEALRRAIPAARCLTLLQALASAQAATAVIEYLGSTRMLATVRPCV